MNEQEKKWLELYQEYREDFLSDYDRPPINSEAFLAAKRQDAERIDCWSRGYGCCSKCELEGIMNVKEEPKPPTNEGEV